MLSSIWVWTPEIFDLYAVLAISVGVFIALGFSELLKKLGASSEMSRKSAHMASGCLAMPFPYLFDSVWPIVFLCGSFLAIMIVSKRLGLFQGVHGVERESVGALVFPLIIILIFVLSHGHPIRYVISIAVLTFSDALAALIGKEYGKMHFHSVGEKRSIEGSTAFFVTTFLIVHVPLLLCTDIGRAECVLMALGTALLTTAFEMISVRGMDNLFIPFGTWYILDNYAQYTLIDLGTRVGFLIFIGLVMLFFVRRNVFTQTGGIAASLCLYGLYSLGWNYFFVPAATVGAVMLTLAVLDRGKKGVEQKPMGLSHFFQAVITGLVILLIYDNTRQDWLLGPFLAACSCGAGFILIKVNRYRSRKRLLQIIIITALAPITAVVSAQGLIGNVVPLAFGCWFCAIGALFFAIMLDRNKAVFQCQECGVETHEERHCNVETKYIRGSTFWTEFRVGWFSTCLGVMLSTGYSIWLIGANL